VYGVPPTTRTPHGYPPTSCEQYLPVIEAMGVEEFSSFSTLYIDELNKPGMGIPRCTGRKDERLKLLSPRPNPSRAFA